MTEVTSLMYKTKCGKCGKTMFTFAKSKLGDIPTVYCSTPCEGAVNYQKRFISHDRIGSK